MHPPPLNPSQHRLSDWPDCTVEIRCRCERVVEPSVRLLIEQHGDHTIRAAIKRLRCSNCGSPFAQAWIVAGRHRTCHGGPDTLDWAVEIKL